MANNTKEQIAKAVEKLLLEKKVKKLTVTDIVEECHITRQAFYYHFADIPELVKWIAQQKTEEALEKYQGEAHLEDQLRYWLLIGINAKDYVEKGMESNYADELRQLIFNQMKAVFITLSKEDEAFQNLDDIEKETLIRYNCHAMIGLIHDWTDKDTENLDTIVHAIYLFATGQLITNK